MNTTQFFLIIGLIGWQLITILTVTNDPEFSDVWVTFKFLNIIGTWIIPLFFMATRKEFLVIIIPMIIVTLIICIDKSPDSFYTIFKNHNHFTFG